MGLSEMGSTVRIFLLLFELYDLTRSPDSVFFPSLLPQTQIFFLFLSLTKLVLSLSSAVFALQVQSFLFCFWLWEDSVCHFGLNITKLPSIFLILLFLLYFTVNFSVKLLLLFLFPYLLSISVHFFACCYYPLLLQFKINI